jgi:hypothetical protein
VGYRQATFRQRKHSRRDNDHHDNNHNDDRRSVDLDDDNNGWRDQRARGDRPRWRRGSPGRHDAANAVHRSARNVAATDDVPVESVLPIVVIEFVRIIGNVRLFVERIECARA